MRHTISFLLGDEFQEIGGFAPDLTVLDWLRDEKRLTGTKEGCNEGDCGACTVVVVRPEGEGLSYKAVNACILFMGMLEGCQLLTVEHLKQAGALHPVQHAMVEHHGSQCGFCTPGFVMSLFALQKSADSLPEPAALDHVLAGNLCRCTGYAPIIRAAESLYPQRTTDTFEAKTAETQQRLLDLQSGVDICIAGDNRHFYAPASQDALASLVATHPTATIVAGATDVGLWVTKGMRRLEPIIWIGRVADMRAVTENMNDIHIDAGVTYAGAEAVLARYYPDFGAMLQRLGSVQVRNSGTIGGNIANGSPIGDASPALMALGATLHLRQGNERRTLPLEQFFLAYGKQDRAAGEFVTAIRVPKPKPGQIFRAYKISKRFDQDISAVLMAISLTLDAEQVSDIKIAFGGMAATPKRAIKAEAALRGKAFSLDAIMLAQQGLAEEFAPISDMRASAAYRLQVAQNLLMRLWHETTSPTTAARLRIEGGLAHV